MRYTEYASLPVPHRCLPHESDRGDEGRPLLRRQALGPLAARLASVLVRVEFNIPFGIFVD
jgi:hypothetical protein